MTDTPHNEATKEGVIHEDDSQPNRLRRGLQLLMRLGYVHPDMTLIVYASPPVCLGTLVTAAKPSIERLHLRNLFSNGRRYHFVDGSMDGFRMETTSKVPWQRRERTRSTATLVAKFQTLDDDLTQINISARVHLFTMWSRFWIPIFFTPLMLFGAWQSFPVRLIELVALYICAWVAYWYSASIDAHDMVYFIEKALEDFMPQSVSELSSHVPHVMDNREDFPDAWEKFYEAHSEVSD